MQVRPVLTNRCENAVCLCPFIQGLRDLVFCIVFDVTMQLETESGLFHAS